MTLRLVLLAVLWATIVNVPSAYASHEIESVHILKVKVAASQAQVQLEPGVLPNQDLCTHENALEVAVLDLDNTPNAHYLYTQLMTAMVSQKPVTLTLDACLEQEGQGSLPVIEAVEVHQE